LTIPKTTDARTGSLTQSADSMGPTPMQFLLYADAENVTAPRGIPVTSSMIDDAPGITSNDRVTVRVLP
jgi:hypothetical protein